MKKDENGAWHFQENWFLNHIWGVNLFGKPFSRPNSICSLFWGSVAGIVLTLIFLAALVLLVILVSLIIWSVLSNIPVAFSAMSDMSSATWFYLVFVSALLISIYFFFTKITASRVCWEYIKAIYRNLCPLIVIDKQEKK